MTVFSVNSAFENTRVTLPRLPGYRLIEQLYSGVRTVVYRAVEESGEGTGARRPVIIKLLQSDQPSLAELIRFRNQYAIARELHHPNVVKLYELSSYQQRLLLVMEDSGGVSLTQYMSAGKPLGLQEFLSIALQISSGLEAIHQAGIIHRDIKPDNIVIHPNTGNVKLIDFSLASKLARTTQSIQPPQGLEGTLAYIAPEQTGRMNRGVDYRSDFYALGVTFYELLAGQLPFQTNEPLALVHCHIARQPRALQSLNPDVPDVIAAMVRKLMAKNAEDRYQSAAALIYDLERCLHYWRATALAADPEDNPSIGQTNHRIPIFTLGKKDRDPQFLIPEKLYGRDDDVQSLMSAFERASRGTTELVLVGGFSGIGKTSVVKEVHKPIVEKRGYFVSGKFDQLNRNIPFSGLAQAFEQLMAQLLKASIEELAQWQQKILAAVEDCAQVIIEVIPGLADILGPQPAVPALSGTAAQVRFNQVFQQFIQVFACREHPLVIFLDDLQWADAASFDLLSSLVDGTQGYLLLIGAYRDNEVFPAHPLMKMVEQLVKVDAPINTLTLSALPEKVLNELTTDVLRCSAVRALPLTQIINAQAKGNPFFTIQMLNMLHQEGLIAFDEATQTWQYDVAAVSDYALTGDVVALIAQRLKRLPAMTQQVLKLAACMGNQFDLDELSIVCERSRFETASALWQALKKGLILPNSEAYKVYQIFAEEVAPLVNEAVTHCAETDLPETGLPETDLLETNLPETTLTYRFLHDRVQQAAYSLISDEDKSQTHAQIGQLLLSRLSVEEQENQLFDLVNHLNFGMPTLKTVEETVAERTELAHLNLRAGKKAKLSAAYQAAYDYFKAGLALLAGSSAWQTDYPLMYSLHLEGAEAAYLSGSLEAAERIFTQALPHCQSPVDTARVQLVAITQYQLQSRYKEAIAAQRSSLALLGWEMPTTSDAIESQLMVEIGTVNKFIERNEIVSLLNAPHLTTPGVDEMMRILQILFYSAWLDGQPVLGLLAVAKMTTLSLAHGNSEMSPFGYVGYGMISVVWLKKYALAHQFGEMAVALCEQFDDPDVRGTTNFLFAADVQSWSQPLRNADSYFDAAYRYSMAAGNWLTVIFMMKLSASDRLTYGEELNELYRIVQSHRDFLARMSSFVNLDIYVAAIVQPVRQLLGLTSSPLSLEGFDDETFREAEFLQTHGDSDYALAWFYAVKIRHAYLFGQYESYEGLLDKIELIERTIGTHAKLPSCVFYGALMRLTLIERTERTVEEMAEHMTERAACDSPQERICHHHWENLAVLEEKLRTWADACPDNLEHKCVLLEAQKARLQHNYGMASELYDQAISLATVNGYDYEAALGNELAAQLYLSWGKPRIAQEYLFCAYSAYSDWGASAKLKDLEQRYQPFFVSSESSVLAAGVTGLDAQRWYSVAQQSFAPQSLEGKSLKGKSLAQQSSEHQSLANQSLAHQSLAHQSLSPQSMSASRNGNSQALDLSSILQASQALSSEIQLDKLVTILLRIAMENAGANRCALLMPPEDAGAVDGCSEGAGWLAKAIAHNYDRFEVVCRDVALADSRVLPMTLAKVIGQYAQSRKQPEALIVANAMSHTQFQEDIYIVQYQPKSLLCLPVFAQGRFYALLYLENTETVDAFSSNHVNVLTMLVSQAAISLENARLYEQQEQLVKARTRELTRALKELKQSQIQLIQREKMSSLGKMVAGIAHEINNPINFISANIPATSDYIHDLSLLLEAYQREHLTPSDALKTKIERIEPDFVIEDLVDILRSMEVGANRVSSIVRSLRSFARLDESELKRVDLHEGLESTLMLLQSRLEPEESNWNIKVNKHYGVLPQVECFAGQLNQVFFGILSNAIDAVLDTLAQRDGFLPCIDIYTKAVENTVHSQAGEIQAGEIQAGEIQSGDIQSREIQSGDIKFVEVQIVDNGVGMSKAVLKQLFDPFFTTKEVGSGTGLGLSIAHQVIEEKHGGRLIVESQPGEGAKFILHLPVNALM